MRAIAVLLAAVFTGMLAPPRVASAATTIGGLNVKWNTVSFLTLSVTPNYASGFGTVKAATGAQPAPSPGSSAFYQGGSVDFGNVAQGSSYLYKYAAHVKVASNASTFKLYAEGSADFTGQGSAAGSTLPIASTIFWLPSVDGSTQSDTNTGYSSATPFQRTTQPGAAYNNPNITYGSYPSPIYNAPGGSADLYYDYQLKLNSVATIGPYFVYVVYTAVPQ